MSYKAQTSGNRDHNHTEIENHLKALGFGVVNTSGQAGFVDMVTVNRHQETCLIEIKQESGAFTLDQLAFMATWKGYAGFACSKEEAERLAKHPQQHSIQPAEAQKLLNFIGSRIFMRKDEMQAKVRVSVIRELLGRKAV